MAEMKKTLRKCIGCGEMKIKAKLLRIVKNKDGSIFIDSTGKKAGRGAYICKNINCFQQAKKERQIEKALKAKISNEIYESLEEQLNGISD